MHKLFQRIDRADVMTWVIVGIIVAALCAMAWPKFKHQTGGSGTYPLVYGVATPLTTSSAAAVTIATGVTGTYHIQAINEGTGDAVVSFDGEQTTPTQGLVVPASSANCPTYTTTLNNSTILLYRRTSTNVSGFSLTGY